MGVDVDELADRHILDQTKNQHDGRYELLHVLHEVQCCVLNGRFRESDNGFTNVTPKGVSVVNYVIVRMPSLKQCLSFKLETFTEIIKYTKSQGLVHTKSRIPDHAMLSMVLEFESRLCNKKVNDDGHSVKTGKKYKFSTMPDDFFKDDVAKVKLQKMIYDILLCQEYQQAVDNLYSGITKKH